MFSRETYIDNLPSKFAVTVRGSLNKNDCSLSYNLPCIHFAEMNKPNKLRK